MLPVDLRSFRGPRSGAMQIIRTVPEMQDVADRLRAEGRRLVLVPTMGSLHRGHVALVRAAGEEGDHVTVSIFVNPTQFGPGEDLERYPRDLEGDLRLLEAEGVVDVVFAPSVEAMYPAGAPGLTWVTVDRMGDHLCGARRPGHFRGVATVVAKLFTACRPHAAVFGLKDAQQFFILGRMAHPTWASVCGWWAWRRSARRTGSPCRPVTATWPPGSGRRP